MKVVCLGGAGAMASSCVYDLYKRSDFEEIVIADYDEALAKKVIGLVDNDPRFSFVKIDASKKKDLTKVMADADYVIDSLPFKFTHNFMNAAIEVGISGVSVNNIGEPDILAKYDAAFKKSGHTMLVGNGGCATTCMMAMRDCEEFDQVDDINIHWGMWRPITHATAGLVETILWEYDPNEAGRRYWDNGKLHRNTPPFGLPMTVEFPEPIGKQEPHIIMHWEPETLPFVPIVQEKNTKRIVVRGVWHPSWTRFVRVMLENGFFGAEPVEVNGVKVSPYDACVAHIIREASEKWQDPYELSKELGFNPTCFLTVEIIGYKNGIGKRTICHKQMPYPYFDGQPVTSSMEYGSYVGLPASISVQMLRRGEITETGALTIESTGTCPKTYIAELEKRNVTFTYEKFIRGQSNISDKPCIPPATNEYRGWCLEED
jgi:saccharopine dehydrogenase-like NADP-dependent oxidoreductase